MKNFTLQNSLKFLLTTLFLLSVVIPAEAQKSAAKNQQAREKGKQTQAQIVKKSLGVDDIVKWNRITQMQISPDGKSIAAIIEPWKGTSYARLYDKEGRELFSSDSVKSIYFTPESDYFVMHRQGKKNGKLIIYSVKEKRSTQIDSVSKFTSFPEWGTWVALSSKDSTLRFADLKSGNQKIYKKVSAEAYAKKRPAGLILTAGRLILVNAAEGTEVELSELKKADKLAISENGISMAWVSGGKLVVRRDNVERLITKGEKPLPEGWVIPSYTTLKFSENGEKLYFGTAPAPRTKDTSVVKGEWPVVQVWSWKEKVQFTTQVIEKESDKKRTYTAVYNFGTDMTVQLENKSTGRVITGDKGNSDYVVTLSDDRYRLEEMWEGRVRYDIHLTNTLLDRSVPVAQGVAGQVRFSPKGNWVYWYSEPDSSWFAWSVSALKGGKITNPARIKAFDEDNDVPDMPSSYGAAGWNEDESAFFVYDKFDMWRVDPTGAAEPQRVTRNGREKGIVYRAELLVKEKEYIDEKMDLLFSAFDVKSKDYGFAILKAGFVKEPVMMVSGPFSLGGAVKAKESGEIIFTKENFTTAPDIWVSDLSFRQQKKITDINPQQNEFVWGTAELVKWTSLDGREMEGVVYKPENFDPSKKYPLIVNFYDRNSSTLNTYRTPEAHRSTIDYHMYNSNGYVIFNPDIVYRDGYPGESAYNCVMPGVASLIKEGYINEKSIGAQGHSWGGYQVAYLATRTNLFAAIESGAPVVNMFSAYGGIRWGTGHNRSFQYEHQQSRIGKTPWEAHQRYIENSPLFTMDKVTTPILIMHNDKDGHVPWYQGIEYFVALKRLQKPVWLLNYSGEVHWPQKIENKMDFQRRMMQFFDHYLKGEKMPKWMDEGLSAVDLDFELGY
ncbi:MAG: peptidase S9 [Bacteroidetes bacterium HGW-Bacteroidetes-10]|nr:MAG: peptidase S9 [Bacteroidetes bacterium HGW-Bacteroidetes-10]